MPRPHGRAIPVPRRMAPLALALALLGAGCGADDPSVDTPTTSAPAGGGVTDPPGAGHDPLTGASTSTVSAPPAAFTHLVAVRVGAHEGFERVVFEFAGGLPGYRIGYVQRPIVEDGSGDEVEVAGAALLEVHMEAASGFDTGAGRPTYTGPRRIDPGTTTVSEVVRATDFEANLVWLIGLKAEVPFRVSTLSDPSRLVVDVASG